MAAIAYHKTVLQAWHELVNALVAYRTEQERRVRLKAQTDHARQALVLSRARYANGFAEFITTLDAQRTCRFPRAIGASGIFHADSCRIQIGVISPKGRLYGEPHRLRELSIDDPGVVNRLCEPHA